MGCMYDVCIMYVSNDSFGFNNNSITVAIQSIVNYNAPTTATTTSTSNSTTTTSTSNAYAYVY